MKYIELISKISGNVSGLRGDVSGLSGDVSKFQRGDYDVFDTLIFIAEQLAVENGEI